MDMSKFEALEEKVSAILGKLSDLSRHNELLEENLLDTRADLERTKKDLHAAQQLIDEMSADRDAILKRVDALLQKLA